MRVALIHDWLTGMRGGERCLEVLCELYPHADVYTLLHLPGRVSWSIEKMAIRTSFVQRLPRVASLYRYYLPLYPLAIESFDLTGYDLVLSTSHCVAKGVLTPPGTCHIAYIHTPMRYIWEEFRSYFGRRQHGWLGRGVAQLLAHYLRLWDVGSAYRPDYLIANSHHVAGRIRKYYGREAVVIHPPVDTRFFVPGDREDEYYLLVSAFAPYKRVDLAIEAFKALRLPLKVVGEGQEWKRLTRLAGGPVELLGWVDDHELAELYAGCRALVFPGLEDFGLTPLEAQACGRPVIAYGFGGVRESVVPLNLGGEESGAVAGEAASQGAGGPGRRAAPTGVFFYEAVPEALARAVRAFEQHRDRFDPAAIRAHALQFDRAVFKERMQAFIEASYNAHRVREARPC